MGISKGNDSMFLAGNHEAKVINTCTENPRVGSSILSLGTIIEKLLRYLSGAFSFLGGYFRMLRLKRSILAPNVGV